tara:strand:- start:2430 stop:2864 length:435 start_codon:yes stop_codon:yes gene_type:complete
MKNAIFSVLILMLVFPAFTPWLPHGAVHAFHDHQAKHHGEKNHGHGHEGHDHNTESEQAVHHPIHFDAVTYFSDYLHVDLQSPEQTVLHAPVLDTYDVDYIALTAISPIPRHELASIQSRAPPDMLRPWPSKTPLYLSTQRIRI